LVAVAECVRDERGWDFGDEVSDGAVARTEKVNAEGTDSVHEGCPGADAARHGVLGKSQSLLEPAPVCRFGRFLRCSRSSWANGAGTAAASLPRLMRTSSPSRLIHI